MHASTLGSGQRDGAVRVHSETDDIAAVCLEGDFDMANAPALAGEIGRALESKSALILDLSEATFIDSSVINVLLRASRAARATKQTIVLQLGTAAIVERALGLASIERVLPRAHDRREAVRIIQQQKAV